MKPFSSKTRLIPTLVLVLVFFLTANIAQAAAPAVEEPAPSEESQFTQEYYESEEYLDSIEDTNRKIDDYLANRISPRSSSTVNLNVPLFQQQEDWYCSFACMEMVLEYLTSADYSQSGIASAMGATGSPILYQVTNYLNSQLGAGTYQHLTTSQYSFSNSLTYSINNNKPLLCLVIPDALPNYTTTGNGGHYVVVKGYYVAFSGTNSTTVCMYNDPHYKSAHYGTYSCTIAEMTEALNDHSGWYIRGAN